VRTGIGLILSGVGAGLTGAPNMAAQFLQRNIDRDIEAQRANLQKKETLLGFMFRKYGNIQDAAQASRSHLLASVAAEVGLAGARAGTQQAAATAKLLQSQLASAAVGPMAQIIHGQTQDAWQRYQVDFQRWMYEQFFRSMPGMGEGEGGNVEYLPSASRPNFTGNLGEWQKAEQEQRLDWKDIGSGRRRVSWGKPGQAKDVNANLGQLNELHDDLNEIEHTAAQATTGVIPWTPVRAKFDALQKHITLLSGPAFADIKRMSEFTKEIGASETGESIWREKLAQGEAIKTTKDIVRRRMDSLLRGQGVTEKALGTKERIQSIARAPAEQ